MEYRIETVKDRPELSQTAYDLIGPAWPTFMLQDKSIIENWDHLYTMFPEYQFGLFEKDTDRLIAFGNSMPVVWGGKLSELPDGGIDWVTVAGIEDFRAGRKPNFQCALQIVIAKDCLGQGLSKKAVAAMKGIGQQNGLTNLIAPVRPNMKHRYPLTPMENYITWQNGDGLPYDNWLRVHVRLGGKIIKVCPMSMFMEGTVGDWEKWTEMIFPESGQYVIPNGLVPIEIDREADRGTYTEPNVWISHTLV